MNEQRKIVGSENSKIFYEQIFSTFLDFVLIFFNVQCIEYLTEYLIIIKNSH